MRIIETKTYEDMSKQAANIIASVVTLKPDCMLGLATGSSPIGTYEELVKKYEASGCNLKIVPGTFGEIGAFDDAEHCNFHAFQCVQLHNFGTRKIYLQQDGFFDHKRSVAVSESCIAVSRFRLRRSCALHNGVEFCYLCDIYCICDPTSAYPSRF